MPDTKQKIVEAASKLFFEEGIAGIRLQQIADEVNISVGNLAYHFKNKEAIVEAVYETMFSELSDILSEYMLYSDLTGFDKQFSSMYGFFERNKFCFNNLWEIARNYHHLQQEWLLMSHKISLQIKKRIEYNVQRNIFKAPSHKVAYDLLTQSLFLTIMYWIPQQMLQQKPVREELYKKALWALLEPHFTESGLKEFYTIATSLKY